ncbi:MAG: PAS domain-containing protein [Rhodospirillaceae bacterium]|nr:PAS domain-containing protein [Rhodospirillaceae bacterium]
MRLIAAWRSLSSEESMLPARSAFRPETVVSLLPRISILERLNAESLVLRLVGEDIKLQGHAINVGTDLLEVSLPSLASFFADTFDRGFGHPCGLSMLMDKVLVTGGWTRVHMLAVPFRGSTDQAPHFLVACCHEVTRHYLLDSAKITQHMPISARWLDLGYGVPGDLADRTFERPRT